ncbi:uncharacterized protein LOC131804434 [Musca domestica]|uniref:Uncharacterized protein LOC131804434 n=1 Tax=Musca domestica TaxID=7370 RepID=A0ABM3VBV2_MUSDO|nr:uncharacterized protein LOC131804434 [Musca domestica]
MRNCAVCKKLVCEQTKHFFKVPIDIKRRLKWSAACGVAFKPKDRICEDHFLPADVIQRNTRCSLMPNAVPSISLTNISEKYFSKITKSQGNIVPYTESPMLNSTQFPEKMDTQTEFVWMEYNVQMIDSAAQTE